MEGRDADGDTSAGLGEALTDPIPEVCFLDDLVTHLRISRTPEPALLFRIRDAEPFRPTRAPVSHLLAFEMF